ncbi:MAG TPA: hypothetical protein VD815_09550 [Candidatus Saccharimonadales bacterium]|nr:hypothetical protein [Candidatus Saccharimonadales bacterium]
MVTLFHNKDYIPTDAMYLSKYYSKYKILIWRIALPIYEKRGIDKSFIDLLCEFDMETEQDLDELIEQHEDEENETREKLEEEE